MDIGGIVHAIAPVSGRQFAWFRVVFGAYLAIHFVHLVPWAAELFSREGVLPSAALNPTYGILPNVLAWWDSPAFVTAFVIILAALSIAFALGFARHAAALLLWYGWACLFNRNVLISNPSIPYVGLLLLLTTLVPAREPMRLGSAATQRDDFVMPAAAYWTAWFLMAAGYTFSGVVKLSSPSWVDGTAFWHILQNPLARDGFLRDYILGSSAGTLRWLTWMPLAIEIGFLPLVMWRWTRPVAWLAMVSVHVGVASLVSFADLSAGMLMIHLFTYDSRWLEMARSLLNRMRVRPAADHRGSQIRAGSPGLLS